MQQAYRVLRIVSEAQTIRIVLSPNPGGLMLKELITACAALDTESSIGIKAVVLDFDAQATSTTEDVPIASINPPTPKEQKSAANTASLGVTQPMPQFLAPFSFGLMNSIPTTLSVPPLVEAAYVAIRAIAQPVLAVVRDTLSPAASLLLQATDLTLVAHNALLTIPVSENDYDTFTGEHACRLQIITWSVPTNEINREMERILNMLREKSAATLRFTKASIRIGQNEQSSPLEALQQINAFYLTHVMQTADAHEGLRAFLEKRKPNWKNM